VLAVLVAVLVAIGAELSRSDAAVVVGLFVVGFFCGLLPRIGPLTASMQLPLLVGFAYSCAFPLSAGSAGDRVLAVLVAAPVYVVAGAVLFQRDARRPLVLGAAAALGGIADALEHAVAGSQGAAREIEAGLVRFRVAISRMKDSALPLGESPDARAARLLTLSVQQASAAAELLVPRLARDGEVQGSSAAAATDGRERVAPLIARSRTLAGALAGRVAVPDPEARDGSTAGRARDQAYGLLADALSDVARAVAGLRGDWREPATDSTVTLPGPLTRLRGALAVQDPTFRQAVRLASAAALAGLVAALLDLTRTYWAVFAAVVAINAPPGLGSRRALMRIGGTIGGFVLGIALLSLIGNHKTLEIALALALLLPGMILMPINYGAGVVFITSMVAVLYSATGEESDFLHFRVLDNLAGAGVVLAIGLLLWRSSETDWWRIAGATARSLAGTLRSDRRREHRGELLQRLLQLRTETVNAAALPDTASEWGASWTFVVAAETLIALLTGRRPMAVDPARDGPLADRLDEVVARGDEVLAGEPLPQRPAGPATTMPELQVARMEAAVTLLDPLRQRDRQPPSHSRP
jgi:uncharacterized membrane protein YccC